MFAAAHCPAIYSRLTPLPSQFEPIDYAIWAARNYGLRLIIPLTDEYQYYHGGKYDFISWAGLSTNSPDLFYTSAAVRHWPPSLLPSFLPAPVTGLTLPFVAPHRSRSSLRLTSRPS